MLIACTNPAVSCRADAASRICSAVHKTIRRCTLFPFGPDFHHRKHRTSGPSFRCSRITLPCCMSSSSLGLSYRIRGALDGTHAFSWKGAEELSWTPDEVCNCRGKAVTANRWGTQRVIGHFECIRGGVLLCSAWIDALLPGSSSFRRSNRSERVALPSLCWPSIGPLQDGVKRRTKGLAPWCQTVFNLRRHLRKGRTHNDSVHCQAAELLPQHLLSDVRYRSFHVGEAHHLASE